MALAVQTLPPALAIMGPTASGKTRLAVELALALNGEIISVDSALVYRGMDIGTSKPGPEERQGVPHHLIDILDPAETFSTGAFRADTLTLLEDITARGRLPILAGGTMLYFNALLHGLSELPAADPALRAEIETEAKARGWPALHAELAALDPEAGARIHPNDPQRIQRALEVHRLTGIPLSRLAASTKLPSPPFSFHKIIAAPGDRTILHERIRLRFLDMMERGFLDEVCALYERGDLHADLPSIRAVGYRQAWEFLVGQCDRETMIERAIIATRQLAKRQITWLRREEDVLRFVSEEAGLRDKVLKAVNTYLS